MSPGTSPISSGNVLAVDAWISLRSQSQTPDSQPSGIPSDPFPESGRHCTITESIHPARLLTHWTKRRVGNPYPPFLR